MVYRDLSHLETEEFGIQASSKKEASIASVADRALSVLFDYSIILPLILLVLSPLTSKAITQYQFGVSFLPILAVSFTGVSLWVLVQTLSLYYWSATIGQKILKIKVISYPDEYRRLSFNQALYRSVAWALGVITLGVPFFEVLTHPKRRTVVDRVSDTLVTTLKLQGDSGPHPMEARYLTSLARLVFAMAVLGLVANVQSSFSVAGSSKSSRGTSLCETDIAKSYAYFLEGVAEVKDCFAERMKNLIWQEGAPVEAYLWHYQKTTNEEDKQKYAEQICSQSLYECELLKAFKNEEFNMPPYVTNKAYVYILLAEHFYKKQSYSKALEFLNQPYSDEELLDSQSRESVVDHRMVKYMFSYLSQNGGGRTPASQKDSQPQWLDEFKKRYDIP